MDGSLVDYSCVGEFVNFQSPNPSSKIYFFDSEILNLDDWVDCLKSWNFSVTPI
jgi:hypothetical protein